MSMPIGPMVAPSLRSLSAVTTGAGDRSMHQIGTLTKALNILDVVATSDRGLSLPALAARLHIPKSTMHRLVTALCDADLLNFDRETHRYTLGLRLIGLGEQALARLQLRAAARPAMFRLAEEFGEVVNLAVLEGVVALYVEKIDHPDAPSMYAKVGRTVPLHCTGLGKALLAFGPTALRDSLHPGALEWRTSRTITDPAALEAELAVARTRGYALDCEEIEAGLSCVAVPIVTGRGCVGALSISGNTAHLNRRALDAMIPQLTEAAREVSRSVEPVPSLPQSRGRQQSPQPPRGKTR